MKLTERSYNSSIFMPKPIVHVEADNSLIIVATVWGQTDGAEKSIEELVKYVSAAREDVEVTSPFEMLTCLTKETNNLRTGLLLANETLYRTKNKTEFVTGIEILVVSYRHHELSWARVGGPHLILKSTQPHLVPLSMSYDLAFDKLRKKPLIAPLPNAMLGIESNCLVECGSVYANLDDQIVLLSSSLPPNSFWQSNWSELDMNSVTNAIVQENEALPFWLGLVDLHSSSI